MNLLSPIPITCVNAWRMGISAICIGEGAGHLKTLISIPTVANDTIQTLNDKVLINQISKNLDSHSKKGRKSVKKSVTQSYLA